MLRGCAVRAGNTSGNACGTEIDQHGASNWRPPFRPARKSIVFFIIVLSQDKDGLAQLFRASQLALTNAAVISDAADSLHCSLL